MKQKKSKRQKTDMLLNFLSGYANIMDKVPIPILVQSLNATISLLTRRGVKIRDWDDREKAVHGFKCLGSSVFLLAPRETPGTEGDADGQDGKSGGERTPGIEKIPTEVLQDQEAAGNPAGQTSEIAPGIPGR